MEIIQEIGKSYLCVDVDKSAESEYAERMLTDNEIKGQPVCRRGICRNTDVLKYDITNSKNLIREYESRSMHFCDISNLLSGIADQLMRGASYLLDEDMYVYDPEYIFFDMETEELNMICIPYKCPDNTIQDRYHKLADFLLDKIDHKDEKAVSIAYQFYRMSKEKLFSMTGFCSVIEKEAGEAARKECFSREANNRIEPENTISDDDFGKERSLYDELNELSSYDRKKDVEEKRDKASLISKVVRSPLIPFIVGAAGFLYYFIDGRNTSYGVQILSVAVLSSLFAAILGIKCLVDIFRNKEEREIEKDMSVCSATVGEYWGADEGTVFFDEETQFFDPDEERGITVEWKENGEERRKKIEGDCIVIGKKYDEVDLCISDPTISRKHAKMTLKSGEVYLRDLGSTNGTYVEGRKINPGEDIKLYNNKDFLLGKVAVRVV